MATNGAIHRPCTTYWMGNLQKKLEVTPTTWR